MELFETVVAPLVRRGLPTALLVLSAAHASAQGIRLNAPLTRLSIDGEVRELALSADGEWLVYMNVLDAAVSTEARLFSLRRGAAAPALVTTALRRFSDFAITPDATQIVYHVSPQPGLTPGIYRAPIDASGPPIQLSPIYGSFAFDPAGNRVVFSDGATGGLGLWVAPLDGSAAPLLLSSLDASFQRVSPDRTRVVFLAPDPAGAFELYSVPIDGSAGEVRLSAPMVANGDLIEFALTPDGTRAVYRADQDLDLADELYSVPLDGSAPPVKLNSPLGLRTQDVTAFRLSASGEYVVYRSDETAQGVFELFSVPVDAGASPLELAGPMVAGGDVGTAFEIHGSRVVYLADSRLDDVVELHQVDVLRRFGPRRLSGDLVAGGDVVQFWIERSGERVVYRADQASDGTFGLWSERLRHPAGPVPLAAASDPEVALGGGRAVFRATPHLFSVPIVGGAAPVQLDTALAPGGSVRAEFQIEPGNAGVLFRADVAVEGMVELLLAPIAGGTSAVSISAPVGGDERAGRIVSAKISADSRRVLFVEDVSIDGSDSARDVLFARELAPSARPVVLYSAPSTNNDDIAVTHLTPNASRVLFTTGSEEGESFQNLFSVPSDASLPAVQLNAPTNNEEGVGSVATTPDGVTAVWSEDGGARGIWAGRADGSATPQLLSTPGTVGPPSRFELTQQGTRVVYLEPISTGTSTRLFTVPVNGSAPPLALNNVVAPRGSNTSFRITPDGARVVYRTDENTDEVYELLVVRVDGVGGPTALSSTLVPNGDVENFQLDATAFRAVFASDRLADGELELFSVLTDGTALPVQLVDLPDASRRTYEYALSPDGTRVVFRADLAAAGDIELWSVPTDGSAVPRRLNGTLVAGGDVRGNFLSSAAFAISPDGARVVYSADERTDEVRELYGVPIDGSTPRVRLSGPFVAGGSLSGSFAITSDSRRVVYVADQEVDERFELFAAPLARPRASVKLSAPLVAGGDVEDGSFLLSPDATAVVYFADQEEDHAMELFMSFLAGPLNQHQR